MSNLPFPADFGVVGVSWHQEVVASSKVGDVVFVYPEPENPYDKNAMRVESERGVLGHLSKELALRLTKEGVGTLSGTICEKSENIKHTNIGIRIKVSPLNGDVDSVILEEAEVEKDDRVVRVRGGGRVLGTYNGQSDGRVSVLSTSGGVVSFPENLVVISERSRV